MTRAGSTDGGSMIDFKPPEGFDLWNRALRGAYRKGWDASAAGRPITACPYKDRRKFSGRLTWSRAFIRAWEDGWDAFRQHDPISAYYHDRANRRTSEARTPAR